MDHNNQNVFASKDFDLFIDKVPTAFLLKKRGYNYLDLVGAFDIETYRPQSSVFNYMYIWQLAIGDAVLIGRTWEEFIVAMERLTDALAIDLNNRLLIFVHNLSFEFQYLIKKFDWEEVFALEQRHPLMALTKKGIEFRCSYQLSGYPLKDLYVTTNLTKVKGYDYLKPRHALSDLNFQEIQYCVNDVLIITQFVRDVANSLGGLHKLPLTRIGILRKSLTAAMWKVPYYYKKIHSLNIDGVKEWRLLQNAFRGGLCIYNQQYYNKVVKGVFSYDICSAYPYALVKEEFPMGSGIFVENITLQEVLNDSKFLYVVDVIICDFEIKEAYKGIGGLISTFKAHYDKNRIIEKGSTIVKGDKVQISLTNLDLQLICNSYTYNKIVILGGYRYVKAPLPKALKTYICALFARKDIAKGFAREQIKQLLNSIYGMFVTSPVRDKIGVINRNWEVKELTLEEKAAAIDEYNKKGTRIHSYVWGVFVASYVRFRLWNMIAKLGSKFVYADTDGIKCIGESLFFGEENKIVRNIIDTYGVDNLGMWRKEWSASRFKMIGKKKYISEVNNVIDVTYSGFSKEVVTNYFQNHKKPFEAFGDNLIDIDEINCMNIGFCDNEISETYKDYNNVEYNAHENGCITTTKTNVSNNIFYRLFDLIR